MVIVAGTIEVDPADRDAFLQGRADAVRATRSEPGCIEYSFSADGIEPGLIRIFEIWESKEQHDRWFSDNVEGVIPGIEQQVIKVHAVVTP